MSPTVLVADGRPLIRRWLRTALEPLGVDVREATTGRHVLELLAIDDPFDLVIASLELPKPGGLGLLWAAGALGRGATPFIVTTAQADAALRRTLAELGDAVLLEEPFEEGDLQALVVRVLAEGALTGERDR